MSIRYSLADLRYLMKRLRDPQTGCPWDIKQSYASIAPSTIEEAYEVVDAIEQENYEHLKEELGDLLFQVVFYGQLGDEQNRFDLDDIIHCLTAKLVRRHPHVFPGGCLTDSYQSGHKSVDDVKSQWEELKAQERQQKGQGSILADIPKGLPAMSRAAKLQKRASRVGFDWPSPDGVLDKIEEEIEELKQAYAAGDKDQIEDELGDVLFTCINFARHIKADPEAILRKSNRKFEARFGYIETQVEDQDWESLSANQLELLWLEAKKREQDSVE